MGARLVRRWRMRPASVRLVVVVAAVAVGGDPHVQTAQRRRRRCGTIVFLEASRRMMINDETTKFRYVLACDIDGCGAKLDLDLIASPRQLTSERLDAALEGAL